ncbi:hypothetical protein HDU91_000587 [Kappamyces sp. JEL0680]|nr:hypothetical protein HDU91_000587 [Kappamyces sp. JEL0680]
MVDLVEDLKIDHLTVSALLYAQLAQANETISDLQQECSHETEARLAAEEKLAALSTRLKAFQTKIQRELCPKTERDAALLQCQEYKTHAEAANAQLSKAAQSIGALQKRQDELHAVYQAELDRTKQLNDQIEKLQSAENAQHSAREKDRAQLTSYEKLIVEMKRKSIDKQKESEAERAALRQELESEIGLLRTQCKELQKKLESTGIELQLSKQNASALEHERLVQRKEAAAHKSQLEELATELKSTNSALREKSRLITEGEKMLVSERSVVSALREDKERLAMVIEAKDSEIKRIQNQLHQREQTLDILNQELSGVDLLKGSLDSSYKDQVSSLDSSLSHMLNIQARLSKLCNSESKLSIAVVLLKKNVNNLKLALKQKDETILSLTAKADSVRQELYLANSKITESNERLKSQQEVILKVRSSNLKHLSELREQKQEFLKFSESLQKATTFELQKVAETTLAREAALSSQTQQLLLELQASQAELESVKDEFVALKRSCATETDKRVAELERMSSLLTEKSVEHDLALDDISAQKRSVLLKWKESLDYIEELKKGTGAARPQSEGSVGHRKLVAKYLAELAYLKRIVIRSQSAGVAETPSSSFGLHWNEVLELNGVGNSALQLLRSMVDRPDSEFGQSVAALAEAFARLGSILCELNDGIKRRDAFVGESALYAERLLCNK